MLFNSSAFLIFFIAVFFIYHFVLGKIGFRGAMPQIIFLTLASFVFYSYERPSLLILLLLSLAVNSLATKAIIVYRHQDLKDKARLVALLAVAFNLAVLATFKYAALIIGTFFNIGPGDSLLQTVKDIPLPIGISFYTFQGISLLVDVYTADKTGQIISGDDKMERHFSSELLSFSTKIAFFISFFPQLIAGPILKAKQFMPQVGAKTIRDIQWDIAVKYLILGFFLKNVVADNLKEVTNQITHPAIVERMPVIDLIAVVYGYSLQIFADFNGYSLIAMGLAALLGYRIPINFNFPYIATSITEFWQRWHISLSSWLREYLYIPLGGNRKGRVRTYINLFIVMFLGGLWHGAAWSFALWGSAHGLFLAIERLFRGRGQKTATKRSPTHPLNLLRLFLVFNLVSWTWLLFAIPDFDGIIGYVHHLFSNPVGLTPITLFTVGLFGFPVLVYHIWGLACHNNQELRERQKEGKFQLIEGAIYSLLLFFVITNSGAPGDFIYFQF